MNTRLTALLIGSLCTACGRTGLLDDWPAFASVGDSSANVGNPSDASAAADSGRIAQDASFGSDSGVSGDSGMVGDADAADANDPSVGLSAACRVDENILVIAGDSFIYNGPPQYLHGVNAHVQVEREVNGQPSAVGIFTDDSSSSWDFSTTALGQPLVAGIYENAQRAFFELSPAPGLMIDFNYHSCSDIIGRFEIIEVGPMVNVRGSLHVKSLTASFFQHCHDGDDEKRKGVWGCVHVREAPDALDAGED